MQEEDKEEEKLIDEAKVNKKKKEKGVSRIKS